MAPPTLTLGTILGVGEGDASTLYVAEQAPDAGQHRVFVSSGSTLYRKYVAGQGGAGGTLEAFDYSFGFQDDVTAAGETGTLFVNTVHHEPVLMALGPKDQRLYGGLDAGDVPLTIVDGGVVRGFALRDLPYVISYVADVSNGESIVVTEAMNYGSTADIRIFYGKPGNMIEYPVLDEGDDCCQITFDFSVSGTKYEALFQLSAGGPDEPSHLATGTTTYSLKLRTPTPKTLDGFSFTCVSGVP